MFNMFSGGALEQLSIFALGIMPYVTASHHPAAADGRRSQALERAQQGGRAGPAQDQPVHALRHDRPVARPGVRHRAAGSRAQQRAYGRSTARSSPIRAGASACMTMHHADHRHRLHHVARRADHRARHRQRHLADHLRRHRRRHARRASSSFFADGASGDIRPLDLAARRRSSSSWSIAAIVFFERGQRRIPVQYAKRLVGRKMYGGQTTHLPLKVNTAGVIPPIFASSILMFPAQIANFVQTPWMQQLVERSAPGRLALQRRSTSC